MATIVKRENGRYLARVRLKNTEKSKTFRTMNEAKEWAAKFETIIYNKGIGKASRDLTFSDLIDRYLMEVTPTKRGERSETLRLNRIKKYDIGYVFVQELTPTNFADWRDARLKEVKPASVSRELCTLSSVCNHA